MTIDLLGRADISLLLRCSARAPALAPNCDATVGLADASLAFLTATEDRVFTVRLVWPWPSPCNSKLIPISDSEALLMATLPGMAIIFPKSAGSWTMVCMKGGSYCCLRLLKLYFFALPLCGQVSKCLIDCEVCICY